MAGRKKTTSTEKEPTSSRDLASLLRTIAAALLGLTLVWSLLQPMDSTSVFDGSALLQNMAWIALALIVAVEHTLSRRRPHVGKLELIGLLLIGMWLWIGAINASSIFNPRTGWNGFWHLIGAIAVYFSARCIVRTLQERTAVLQILLAGAISLSVVALYQVKIAFPEMRQQFYNDPEKQLAQMGIDAPEGSPTRKRLEDRLNSPEPYATYALTNSLAAFLSAGLVLSLSTLAFGLFSRSMSASALQRHTVAERKATIAPSLIALTIAGLLIAVVWFLTRSRVALLAVPMTLGIMIVASVWQSYSVLKQRLSSNARNKIGLALTITLVAFSVGAFLLWRKDPLVFSEATKSLTYRFEYWRATLKIIQQFPTWGVGLGNFQSVYPQYMSDTASETIADPHNWILDLASCCSVPVAILVVIAVARTILAKPTDFANNEPTDSANNAEDNSASYHRALNLGAIGGSLLVMLGMYVFGQEAGLITVILLSMVVGLSLSYLAGSTISALVRWSNISFKAVPLVMLGCLMISGSWQAAGLLVPILVCLAISRSSMHQNTYHIEPTWWTRSAALIWAIVLVSFVYWSWIPIVDSQLQVASAYRDVKGQLESVERARTSDPWNAEWDRFRAKLLVDVAIAADADRFEQSAATALDALATWTARQSMSFLTWQFAGDCCLELAGAAQKKSQPVDRFLEAAEAHFDRAVRARPSSAQLHLQHAYCLALKRDMGAASLEVERAEEISRVTPHADQRIEAQLIWIPYHPAELSPQNSTKPFCRAELVVDWIRSQQKQL